MKAYVVEKVEDKVFESGVKEIEKLVISENEVLIKVSYLDDLFSLNPSTKCCFYSKRPRIWHIFLSKKLNLSISIGLCLKFHRQSAVDSPFWSSRI